METIYVHQSKDCISCWIVQQGTPLLGIYQGEPTTQEIYEQDPDCVTIGDVVFVNNLGRYKILSKL